MTQPLEDYGWNERLAHAWEEVATTGDAPARVAKQSRGGGYDVIIGAGETARGRLAGPLAKAAGAAKPAVGDWVAVQRKARDPRLAIRALLPRASAFVRRAPGLVTREQVVAANVDVVFLVMSLDQDFNLRRLERYLTLAWDSGARPVVVLSKADLCEDTVTRKERVAEVAPGVEVLVVSVREEPEAIAAHLSPGVTGAFLGSSGVGKSTLVNRLAGAARMRIGAGLAEGARGRHTTSHRQLILLPHGGLVIDTPGMRELQLWAEAESLEAAFSDVSALGAECRFRDCRHEQEPGCAVQRAVRDGRLTEERLRSYQTLREELGVLAARQAEAARLRDRRDGQRSGRDSD